MTPAEVARRNRVRILLAFAAVYFLWGSTFLAIKYAVETIPPFVLGGTRFLIAGVVLYGIALLRGARHPTLPELRIGVLTGVLMLTFGNGAVIWAEQTVPSGMVALIVATVPLWMVLIDWLRPRGRRPRAMVFVGLALGLAGIAGLIGPDVIFDRGVMSLAGAGIVVAGSLSWAFGSIITRRSERPRSRLMSAAVQMLAGGVAFYVLSLIGGEPGRFAWSAVTTKSLLSLAYLVVAGSLIGFTAYNYLLGTVSAAKAATYAYVNPVVAMLLGWALASEPIGTGTLVAAAVILAGVAIITTATHREPAFTGEHPVPTEAKRAA